MKKTGNSRENKINASAAKYRKYLVWGVWLLIWEVLALIVHNRLLLASPVQTLTALVHAMLQGSFYLTVTGSLVRIAAGFILGLVCGLLLAAAAGKYALLEDLLKPFMRMLTTVPVASMVVLLLIWWGSTLLSAAVCFIVVLPIIYQNTLSGIKATDSGLLEMARVFDIPFSNKLWYIYRPALIPFWESAMKLSLGLCWKSGVAAEVIGTPDYSIGEKIYLSKVYLDTADLFAWTAAVIVLCVVFEKFVLSLAERFYAWEPACRAAGTGKIIAAKAVDVSLQEVSKSFGETKVLSHEDRTFPAGEISFLRDPSGSGKTTLLRLLAGLEEPDEGKVSADGVCSMLFQEDRLCGAYSAIKNIELITGDKRTAKEALEKVLPGEALHKPCEQLSGGMKRRVALVRAMEAASDIVLLDEPFTGLDAEAKSTAEAYINERKGSRTVVIASHI